MALYGVLPQAFCLQLRVLHLLVFLDFGFIFQLVSCQSEEPILLNVYKTVPIQKLYTKHAAWVSTMLGDSLLTKIFLHAFD